jgi:hypothetical protein
VAERRAKRLYRIEGMRDGVHRVRDYQSKTAADVAASKWSRAAECPEYDDCDDPKDCDNPYHEGPMQGVRITRSLPIVWETESREVGR